MQCLSDMFVLIGVFDDSEIAVQISAMPERLVPRGSEIAEVVAPVAQANEIWWAHIAAFHR